MPALPSGAPARTSQAFALLALVQMLLISGITVLSVSLPALQRELGLDQGELALSAAAAVLAVFSLSGAALQRPHLRK